MREFLGDDFLLSNETAKHLYFDHAKELPIVDYHCHLSPKEIYEDVHYDNITQVWLGGDHYKWRQMRSNGVPEHYITGDASDYEKFEKWAETLEMAIGNPLYHWSHLELKNYFGWTGHLKKENAREVYEFTKKKLQEPDMSARNLILKSNVSFIGTTDDPADTLEWHQKLREDGFPVTVAPSFRPDRARNIEKPDFVDYMKTLGASAGVDITGFPELVQALRSRLDFFAENGCKVTDHGIESIIYEAYTAEEADAILKKRLQGETLTNQEARKYKTALMVELGRAYNEKHLVMQLHYAAGRNLNTRMFNQLGPDTGYDAIGSSGNLDEIGKFLDALAVTGELPKTMIYSLNPIDDAAIGTIIGSFQDDSAVGKIQHGAAWWFNDHKTGMINQMTSLANLGLLGNFVGMLTDSRSFLSYARHEYFRRIMCNLIGTWVENGEYPNDEESLTKIVEGISYYNAKRYFEL